MRPDRRFQGAVLRLLTALSLMATAALAATPVDVYEFASAEQESRYRALIAEFRCPKCLNTNLAGSDAPIAQDLRRTVHRLLVTEGRTDAEIRNYLQTRYGDFVLYNPPLRADTLFLWLAPLVLLVIGFAIVAMMVRRARREHAPVLDDHERQRLRQLLEDD